MVDKLTIKKIISRRRGEFELSKFEKYIKEANRLFGTDFRPEDFA